MIDGLPEAVLIGFLAAEDKLTIALVVALMLANFPEGFSAGVVLSRAGVSAWRILLLWFVVMAVVGTIAALTALLLPQSMLIGRTEYSLGTLWLRLLGGFIEGLAGGAMLSSVANVMLPAAFQKQGD